LVFLLFFRYGEVEKTQTIFLKWRRNERERKRRRGETTKGRERKAIDATKIKGKTRKVEREKNMLKFRLSWLLDLYTAHTSLILLLALPLCPL